MSKKEKPFSSSSQDIQLVLFRPRPNVNEMPCHTCHTTRCCVDHCCNWDKCNCGDCVMCGGPLPLELDPTQYGIFSKKKKDIDAEATPRGITKEEELKKVEEQGDKKKKEKNTQKKNSKIFEVVQESNKENTKKKEIEPNVYVVESIPSTNQNNSSSATVVEEKSTSVIPTTETSYQRSLKAAEELNTKWNQYTKSMRELTNVALQSLLMSERTKNLSDEDMYDSEEQLAGKIKELATLIQKSKHVVIFTGAGISTGSNIPDYRGNGNEAIYQQTGITQEEMQGNLRGSLKTLFEKGTYKPSFSHWSISELYRSGLVKHVITQNVDSLHYLANLPLEVVSELHGNVFIEKCSQCGANYVRSKPVEILVNHLTGNMCEKETCKAPLVDFFVNFGENLPEKTFQTAKSEAEKADLCIVVGSSLRVAPACYLPLPGSAEKLQGSLKNSINPPKKLVIINLQETPYDSEATININAKCDDVFEKLMIALSLKVKNAMTKMELRFKPNSSHSSISLISSSSSLTLPTEIPATAPVELRPLRISTPLANNNNSSLDSARKSTKKNSANNLNGKEESKQVHYVNLNFKQ